MRTTILFTALFSAALLFSGCTWAKKDSGLQSLEKVLAGGPIQLQLEPGKFIQVVLDGNATTGYTWQVENMNPEIVTVEKGKYIPVNTDRVGAPGKYTWKVKSLAPGKAKLVFRYYRTWEGFDPKNDREQIYLIDVTK